MTDTPAIAEYRALLAGVEPAARVVPPRALRRAIRHSRDRGTFRPHATHDRSWWVPRDDLFEHLTPPELDLSPDEPFDELLLVPAPDESAITPVGAWRTLFHAAVDREIDLAARDGRLTEQTVLQIRRQVGPARWAAIRTALQEQHLIDESDPDMRVFREFAAFGLELARFQPDEWHTVFPGISPEAEPLRTANRLLDVDRLHQRTRPVALAEEACLDDPAPAPPVQRPPPPDPAVIASWVERGNDLKAAVLTERSAERAGLPHLTRLVGRLAAILDLDEGGRRKWLEALIPLLGSASRGGWPVERRLLYDLQRACLSVEQLAYSADLVEWLRTFGRRPIKRPLPKTRWLEAARRLRAALAYVDRLPGGHPAHESLAHLLTDGLHATEAKAREDLRPDLVAVLDEVGLIPQSLPERLSRAKLVDELLDAACARGFLRIGDLRDAIARSRVKLPDLRGPSELVRGDSIIRANELLPVRLDGVYRRGEIYMRLLQRACSLAFGTRAGRWLTRFIAIPFGGAFILLEGASHLYEAGEGLVHWLSGWTATVNGMSLLGGGAAGTLASNPTLEKGGVGWPPVVAVGIFLLLMIHWSAFRARVVQAARFSLVKVPRTVRRSPIVRGLIHNPLTRFFRRHLLLPAAAGGATALVTWIAGADPLSVALVGGGTALFAGSFVRTPFGREVEDRFDEAMERLWRVVSVNFAVGVLTWILQFFRAVFEAIDRAIHAVDEALRFREGQSRPAFLAKAVFGAGWFVFAYLFRFAWTLLVEPQINPIKHFPVVTVSHKILLPLIGPLSKQFGIAKETMTTIVFGIPGIFGFLVWELKENWKVYRANSPREIGPIQVGSHGETVQRLLRPGLHSGTVPKAFTKLRRAVRTGTADRAARQRHVLEHVGEAVDRFADRAFLAYLRASRRWGDVPADLGHLTLSPNRIVLPVEFGPDREPTEVAIEERNGWLIGSIAQIGWLADASAGCRAAFADALMGLYKRAGVHVVREQIAAELGTDSYSFDAIPEGLVVPQSDGTERLYDYDDGPELVTPGGRLPRHLVLTERPLPWSDWVDRWEADAAGTAPLGSLIPGWTVLPPARPA